MEVNRSWRKIPYIRSVMGAVVVAVASYASTSVTAPFIARHSRVISPQEAYPTADELSRRTGHRVVILVDEGDAQFAQGFCWAVDLPSNLDKDRLGGIGCVTNGVANDLNDDVLSLGEQMDVCKSVGGKIDNVTHDPKNPTDVNGLDWACVTKDPA